MGQMILMYLNHMEKGVGPGPLAPMRMDLVVLILDIFFYALITLSYILLLIRISVQVNTSVRQVLYGERGEDYEDNEDVDPELTTITTEGGGSGYLTRF